MEKDNVQPKPKKPRKPPKPRFRHRASKEFKKTLKPKAKKQDWKKLVDACVAAIINHQELIVVSFSYVFKYPEGFPKGLVIQREGLVNLRRIKVFRLIEWLYENKHSKYNYRDIVLFRREFARKQTDLMNQVDIDLGDKYNFDVSEELDVSNI